MNSSVPPPAIEFSEGSSTKLATSLNASLLIKGIELKGSCDVELNLFSDPRIYINAVFENVENSYHFMMVLGSQENIKLMVDNSDIRGFILSCDRLEDGKLCITWCPQSSRVEFMPSNEPNIQKLTFHLFNFNKIIGNNAIDTFTSSMSSFTNVLNLNNDQWETQIFTVSQDVPENLARKDIQKQFSLSHVGEIIKKSGPFTGKEVIEELNCLKYALSFSVGSWVEPVCPVGYGSDSSKVWNMWSTPHKSKGKPFHWLDFDSGSDLSNIYPKFSNKWKSENWQKTLKEVIYWYIHSNDQSVNIDAGIILTITAIERLSYEYTVNERQLISREGFKKLRHSDMLRLLFASLNIPVEISGQKKHFFKKLNLNNKDSQDAAFILSEVRNSLIHPDNKFHGKVDGDIYFKAWTMSQWYLELSILAIIGYDGKYIDRTLEGFTSRSHVPWNEV